MAFCEVNFTMSSVIVESSIDNGGTTSNNRIEDDDNNSLENEPYLSKTSPETGSLSEDFIIVENPEFSHHSNSVLVSVNDLHSQSATGVENDILPPPRTLDDVPRRGGRRRGVSKANKTKRQKYVKNVDNNSKTLSHVVQIAQSKEKEINYNNGLLQPQREEKTSGLNLNQDEDIVEVQRSASYGLRRKFQSKDFSYDSDFFLEKEDESLVKPYACPECQRRCRTKRELQDHQVTEHDNHKCDLCDNSFTTLLGLKRHVTIKHSQTEYLQTKMYACSECEVSFEIKAELKQHQFSVHGQGKEHVCDMCGNDFTSLLGLQKHIALKHSETECSLCNETFKLGQALLDHMKVCGRASLASEMLGIKVPKPKIYPCKICGKKFSEKSNRFRHMKLHQGILNFTCDHCGKKCSEKQALLSHIRHIHTGERPYNCDMCPRSFATQSDLRRHRLTVHTDLRRFPCTDCGKAFKTREALKCHLKIKSGEKLWQCGVCSKKFISKGSLKAHMVVHSGIKMYECETCQRQFTHKGSLEAHVRVHTGLMPYICPKCGKKFAHLQNRNRHVRTMHGNSDEC